MPSPLKLNLILLLFVTLVAHLALPQATKPDQVIELFRHGARTPIFKYDRSWPVSEGVLTTVGMLQHYNLGKKLAERYPHLVESGYNPDDVYVLSNFVPRCIDSALAHVSSMFRGKTSTLGDENPQRDRQEGIIQRVTPHLPENETDRGEFVPVKVDVVSNREQEFIFNGRNQNWCPVVEKYRKENEYSAEMAQSWRIFEVPANKANAFLPLSQKIRSMAVLNTAFDAFIADVYEKRALPGNIDDPQLIESLNYGQAYYQELLEHLQPIQKGLTSFPTLNAMVEQLQNFREGKSPKKLAFFSGHDLNVYAILSAFGIISAECLMANYQDHIQDEPLSFPNCQYPKFASNLIFEFYNDTTNPYVKFYYNDVLIPLCNGQETCTYGEFLSFVKRAGGDYTLQTWTDTCNGKPIQQKTEDEKKSPSQENQNSEPKDQNTKSEDETSDPKDENDKTVDNSSSNPESENTDTKTESENQNTKTKEDQSSDSSNEGSDPKDENDKTVDDSSSNRENENPDTKTEPENQNNETKDQSVNQKDQNEDQNSNHNDEDETSRAEPQEDQTSHQENQNTEPQAGQTASIKTIQSKEEVNKWLIVGSSVMAAFALALTLKTCIKYKWWNPFRRFKQGGMFKQRDEIEV